jgi:hypothetical protein
MTLEDIKHLIQSGDVMGALTAGRMVLLKTPDDPELLLYVGICAATVGDYRDGEKFLLKALSSDTGDMEPYAKYNLAICFERTGTTLEPALHLYKEAALLFQMLGKNIEADKSRLNAAWMLAYHDRVDDAEQVLSTILVSDRLIQEPQAAIRSYIAVVRSMYQVATEHAAKVLESDSAWCRALGYYVMAYVSTEVGGDKGFRNQIMRTGLDDAAKARDSRMLNLYMSLRRSIHASEGEMAASSFNNENGGSSAMSKHMRRAVMVLFVIVLTSVTASVALAGPFDTIFPKASIVSGR